MQITRALCLALSLALTSWPANAGKWIEGSVTHVRDVDTIEVNTLPIRFDGIDGPELGTRAGDDGKRWMQRLVLRKPVRCYLTGAKSNDRHIGTCYLPTGENLGALAIAAGLARDCPRYSKGAYAQYETDESRSLPQSSYCR